MPSKDVLGVMYFMEGVHEFLGHHPLRCQSALSAGPANDLIRIADGYFMGLTAFLADKGQFRYLMLIPGAQFVVVVCMPIYKQKSFYFQKPYHIRKSRIEAKKSIQKFCVAAFEAAMGACQIRSFHNNNGEFIRKNELVKAFSANEMGVFGEHIFSLFKGFCFDSRRSVSASGKDCKGVLKVFSDKNRWNLLSILTVENGH
jgi:hypothetical protein